MSLLTPSRGLIRQAPPPDIWSIIRGTSPRWGAVPTPDQAMRNSVLWACLDLRASLVSSLPVEQYTEQPDGRQKSQQLAPLWRSPGPGSLTLGGPVARLDEWLYATQMDLDRFGNTFGVIVQRDGLQRPLRIDLIPARSVTVKVDKNGQVVYLINGKPYAAEDMWHERAHVVAGSPVGLDPLACAAMAMGMYESTSEFAAGWFNSGGIASATLKNTMASLQPDQAQEIKERVKATLAAGDVLVLGKEYEYNMVAVPPNQTAFLELIQATQVDLTRFMGVPGDMVDVHQSGTAVTYANITQRNLQFLIMHLGPAIRRREQAMSAVIANPQRIELETKGLLRMDPMQLATMRQMMVNSRAMHPNEWRAEENMPALTADQIASFIELFPRVTAKLDGLPVPVLAPDPAEDDEAVDDEEDANGSA